ncbi:class I SAM-dependent methyltransferase [Tellurirhabdus rosea]|uniref:class I SAM-dependent methyltransferase n=1 Tax=Tellurirhabdus rosea TaxID=2674997 RepID=UPI0022585D81|nr:class I SAM-dependent methyltransferase [Tellurirhabdus rosea]
MKLILLPLALFGLLTDLSCGQSTGRESTASQTADSLYQYRDASRDGIGKQYQGREIAQVMGHLGADWLDRPEREQEERTDLLLDALALKPTDVVADIGAGTGYFTFRMAPAVPQGRVLAVDIQPEMIEYLNENRKKQKASNVQPVLGTITDPKLPPNSIDMALMVDAYHEFSHPYEMMRQIVKALRPGGRVVLVEYRAEDPSVPIKPLHKMSVRQATREMKAVGLMFEKVARTLPQQHIIFFKK